MLVSGETKIFLLPSELESGEFDIIRLPLSNKTTSSFLAKDNEVYELRQVGSKNPWLKNDKSVTIPRTGGAVKSLIIEHGESGSVLQSPDMIVATKFDLSFVFINIMIGNDTFSKRFISYEDILDTIGNQNEWISSLSDSLIVNCINKICDTVVENQESFYKYSPEKTTKMLLDKVSKVESVLNSSNSSLSDHIRQQLYDPTSIDSKIPTNIYGLALKQHAVDLVCCYAPVSLREEVKKQLNCDFGALEEYMKQLKQKKKAVDAAEQTMNDIAASTNNAKKANAKTKLQKKVTTKKVAVGKGALDSFFKRS